MKILFFLWTLTPFAQVTDNRRQLSSLGMRRLLETKLRERWRDSTDLMKRGEIENKMKKREMWKVKMNLLLLLCSSSLLGKGKVLFQMWDSGSDVLKLCVCVTSSHCVSVVWQTCDICDDLVTVATREASAFMGSVLSSAWEENSFFFNLLALRLGDPFFALTLVDPFFALSSKAMAHLHKDKICHPGCLSGMDTTETIYMGVCVF